VVPPLVLLAAVHGIALAVRAGASGWVYRCAVGAVAAIGVGAFAVSFLALRDLMQTIGYSTETAWIFPAIIDTAVAVSTVMLVALGDKPARRLPRGGALTAPAKAVQNLPRATKQQMGHVALPNPQSRGKQTVQRPVSASVQPNQAHIAEGSAQMEQNLDGAGSAQVDADLASELIASGVTTQPIETVISVLTAIRDGASINAAAKASAINYRTAQRIVGASTGHGRKQVQSVG
jgi:hypothetical protein